MPIIFASSFLILPGFLAQATTSVELQKFASYLSPGSDLPVLYVTFYLVLIVFFSYFYASLILNPEDLSKNLKKMGSSIPGIRPGKATAQYITQVVNRLTFLGAVFLGAVAIVPTAVESAAPASPFQGLGATSLLILVGVAIDTAKQIQTYVISQRYEKMIDQ
jgi:preprotein translocase subunit SecY